MSQYLSQENSQAEDQVTTEMMRNQFDQDEEEVERALGHTMEGFQDLVTSLAEKRLARSTAFNKQLEFIDTEKEDILDQREQLKRFTDTMKSWDQGKKKRWSTNPKSSDSSTHHKRGDSRDRSDRRDRGGSNNPEEGLC
jgi:hypothetical protein